MGEGHSSSSISSSSSSVSMMPAVALLVEGPFTDYSASALMLAAYMGRVEVRGGREDTKSS